MTRKISTILVALAILSLGMFITETSAQPTVITACGAITAGGSYRLGNNLQAPPGTCLSVSARDVTIDLDGFVITGGFGRNAIIASAAALTVRNGTIATGGFGISASDGLLVDRVTFDLNSDGGVLAGNQAIVKDSVFLRAGNDGQWAIQVQSGLVTRNVILGGGNNLRGGGVLIDRGTVSGNVLNGSSVGGQIGLRMTGGGAVINNTVQNYSIHGLDIMCPSNVLGNTATGNGVNLVLHGDHSTCNVEHNVAP